MLDFLFRRGNPTNRWQRIADLSLAADLSFPALNGITLGSPLERISFLGRNDDTQFGTLCYYDLGLGVDRAPDGTFSGFTVVLADELNDFRPFRGKLLWHEGRIRTTDLRLDRLQNVFGEWYWLDADEDELTAFFEFPHYEMQLEMTLAGVVKRLILTSDPLLAQPEEREFYRIDKPWPPASLRG